MSFFDCVKDERPIEKGINQKRVVEIGSKVKIQYIETNEIEEYIIVQIYRRSIPTEMGYATHSDFPSSKEIIDKLPEEGEVSNESPLGRALLGNKKGDVVKIKSPTGYFSVRILEVTQKNDEEKEHKDVDSYVREYKDDYLKIKKKVEELEQKYGFNGPFHVTDYSNLQNIIKEGYLYGRYYCKNNNINFKDAADQEVIGHTMHKVTKCTRFYYKEKTPTLYDNEGIKRDNLEPHLPIPVYLQFDSSLLYQKNAIYCDGNAGSSYSSFGTDSKFFDKMDWDEIFKRGSLPDDSEKRNKIRIRNAELLISRPVSLEKVKFFIFRSKIDLQRAVNDFGPNDKFIVDSNMFNCHNNFVKSYNREYNEKNKEIKILIGFNRPLYREERVYESLDSYEEKSRLIKEYEYSYGIYDKRNNQISMEFKEFDDDDGLNDFCKIMGFIDIKCKDYNSSWDKFKFYINDILVIDDQLRNLK